MRLGHKKEEGYEKGESPEFYTLQESFDKSDNDIKEFLANLEYWKYLPELNVIRHHKRRDYEVDFDTITNDAELCDWIMHINTKEKWIEDAAILEFMDFASIYREDDAKNYDPGNINKYF
ncbi:MAG: hypothetical protein AB3A66_09695 [Nodularia sp. CChRGM 3473]